MRNIINKVNEFYRTYKVDKNYTPSLISGERSKVRFNLMKEENDEYLEACENNDLTEIADALGDQLYILVGTILEHGLADKIAPIFNEIHRSNMSKLDENGLPIYREDGKVIKGHNYFKPNLSPILQNKKSIIKRSGKRVLFNVYKIYNAIEKSFIAVGSKHTHETLTDLTGYVEDRLELLKTDITVEKVQDAVEDTLMLNGHTKEAKAFILYRNERNKNRNN